MNGSSNTFEPDMNGDLTSSPLIQFASNTDPEVRLLFLQMQEQIRQLEGDKRELKAKLRSLQTDFDRVISSQVPTVLQDEDGEPNHSIVRAFEANRRLALLNSLSDRIRSSLNPQTVLQTLVDSLGQALQVDRCILIEFEANHKGQVRPVVNYQYPLPEGKNLPLLIDQPHLRQLFTTAEPIIISNLREMLDEASLERYAKAYAPPAALMGMPLFANNQQIAFLGVVFLDAPHNWTSFEIDFLLDVAERAEVAITNARLFTQAEMERARVNAVLDSMNEGVVVLDNDGNVMELNAIAEKLLGVTLAEVLGQPAPTVLPIAIQNQSHYQLEYNEQILAVTTSALDGTWERGTVSVLRDVTQEARIQRAKDNFMMLISHELRTPLTSIHGALEILEDVSIGNLNPIQSDFLKLAITNTNRLHRLLNIVLDITEIETGRIQLNNDKIGLASLVQNVLAKGLNRAYEAKEIVLELDIRATDLVYADARRLSQIMEQLMSNACKFNSLGGKVKLSAQPEGAEWLRIAITDTGIGMSPADCAHIGEKFFRVDHSLTREVGGSGLGLAITKALVELHGNQLEVISTPGEGSTFSFRLPVPQK